MARRLTVGWSTSRMQKQAITKTMNHGRDRGPSQRLPMNMGSNSTVDGM